MHTKYRPSQPRQADKQKISKEDRQAMFNPTTIPHYFLLHAAATSLRFGKQVAPQHCENSADKRNGNTGKDHIQLMGVSDRFRIHQLIKPQWQAKKKLNTNNMLKRLKRRTQDTTRQFWCIETQIQKPIETGAALKRV